MQPQLRRRFGLITLTVLFFLAAPSLAARRGGAADGGSDVRIARATIAPHLVSFEPLTDYEVMSLRVTDGGRLVFEGEFAAGEAVLFDLFDLNGNPLADGTYFYELKATPKLSPEIRAAMQASRDNGTDGEAAGRLREIGLLPKRGSMAMSGAFTILNGAVVDPDLPEETAASPLDPGYNAASAPQDVVVNDDKIITGSLCVGFDCVNGETFGFDTVRLKENNLREHFQDTSNSASFPTRDWRWVINDSTNGGANYMGLQDIDNSGRFTFRVFSGASNNALVVDAQGDVGLTTATPVTELHIVDGDTPTMRLEQDGSSGFAQQSWDVAGNETNFFIRDVTNGSRLPFRIRPNAPTSSIDVAGTSGDVGLGTAAPGASLHILRSTGTAQLLVEKDGAASSQTMMVLKNESGNVRFELDNEAGDTWRISNTSSGLNWNNIDNAGAIEPEMELSPTGNLVAAGTVMGMSSRASKLAFEAIDTADILDKVAALDISEWSYKTDPPAVRHIGPVSEEFNAAFGVGSSQRHLSFHDLSGVALASIQALNQKVGDLQKENAELKAKIEALIAALEK